jgi:hypothetical protein
MAACFDCLEKINPLTLTHKTEWTNCFTAKDIDKYIIPLSLNKPHGKGVNTLIEKN